MEAAQKIRAAVDRVSRLRAAFEGRPGLRDAVGQVKRFQSRRFAGTYADLLAQGRYAQASQFFLQELYGDKDYSERDAQFARIAGAIERFFPRQVVETAVSLAELHALTEELDQFMALAWLEHGNGMLGEVPRYVQAWRTVQRRAERERQVGVVMALGQQMARLTRTPGLRMMLKMMRGPANAAGLSSLQTFLESGFDTFAGMAKKPGQAEEFLDTIRQRELALLDLLFDAPLTTSEGDLAATLGQAP